MCAACAGPLSCPEAGEQHAWFLISGEATGVPVLNGQTGTHSRYFCPLSTCVAPMAVKSHD